MIFLDWSLSLSLPPADKTQYFGYLSLNSTLQLINGISSDLKKLEANGTRSVAFFRTPLATDSGLVSVISAGIRLSW